MLLAVDVAAAAADDDFDALLADDAASMATLKAIFITLMLLIDFSSVIYDIITLAATQLLNEDDFIRVQPSLQHTILCRH